MLMMTERSENVIMFEGLTATAQRSKAQLLRSLAAAMARGFASASALATPPSWFDQKRRDLWDLVAVPGSLGATERCIVAGEIDALVRAVRDFERIRRSIEGNYSEQEGRATDAKRRGQFYETVGFSAQQCISIAEVLREAQVAADRLGLVVDTSADPVRVSAITDTTT